MNTFKFLFIDQEEKKYDVSVAIEDPQLVIDDTYIADICKRRGISNIAHCFITIAANNMAVIIKEYTLTKCIHISGFFNTESYISMLQSINVDLHITGQQIKHLQADCKNILIADCQVEQFQIGLFSRFVPKDGNEKIELFRVDKVDLRDTEVKVLDIFAECKNVNIQRSRINEIMFHGGMLSQSAVFDLIHIWYNTIVDKMTLSSTIRHLKMDTSRINWLHAHPTLRINELTVKSTIVDDCYGFIKNSFENPLCDAWLWINKSAKNSLNAQLRSESSYEMVKTTSKTAKGIDKFFGGFFDFCAGYGYKPTRIFLTSGWIILISTIIYSIIDLVAALEKRTFVVNWSFLAKVVVHIWDNMLLAAAALVGQGSLTVADGIAYWVSVLEALFGIILFATFVNALYLRYKD